MPPKRKRIGGPASAKVSKKSAVGGGKKPSEPASSSSSSSSSSLQDEFVQLLSQPQFRGGKGIANMSLKAHFGDEQYPKLVPIINELMKQSRLTMSRSQPAHPNDQPEVYFALLSTEEATKLLGLDGQAKMVYQVVEASGNKGIWTVDVRSQTGIPQSNLAKIFKALENRRLIKPIKSVTAKTKKLYMLFDLTPSKDITGGPWYTEYEFDHEFIAELRNFILMCVRRMNRGDGVTLKQIANKMIQANVSRVQLSLDEVQQVLQTLAFDYLVEQRSVTADGEALFVAAKQITTCCNFGQVRAYSSSKMIVLQLTLDVHCLPLKVGGLSEP